MTTRNSMSAEAVNKKTKPRIAYGIWLKPLVFVLSLVPLGFLIFSLLTNRLGANPIEALSRETGEWTLRFLLLGLLATPLQLHFKIMWPANIRRMIGLFAFFYGCVHLLVFIGLDQQFQFADIVNEIFGKPYLLAGLISIIILLPLAVTSNRAMIRRLGKRWKPLHRWVYLAVLSGCLHFVWLAKGDKPEPLVYLTVFMLLLLWRFVRLLRK